jgi:ketosteroid isomerase-like protein
VELTRQAYDAYNREGINGILVCLDSEIEWRKPAEAPNAGVFVGHEGVVEWQRMVDDAWKEMDFEPDRIDELPDGRVLAVLRARMCARASEVSIEVPIAHLATWRDGRATELRMYTSEAAAREAAGLEE